MLVDFVLVRVPVTSVQNGFETGEPSEQADLIAAQEAPERAAPARTDAGVQQPGAACSRALRGSLRARAGTGCDQHAAQLHPQVKYAGTSGIWIEKMGNDEVVMTLKNRFRCVVCPPLRALVRAARTGPPLPPAAAARRVQRANCATPCACRVQNHIKGVHACGMALLAESATGAVFGMNLPGHDHVSKSSA